MTIVLPTVAITLNEASLYFGNPSYALTGHLVTLVVLLLALARTGIDPLLLQAFTLIPLFRLVNLGMPVFFPLTIYWLPLIYATLVPALYLIGRNHQSLNPRLGLRRGVPLIVPLSLLLGLLFGTIEYRILQPAGLISAWTLPQAVVLMTVMIGFVGLVEELLFRGILQRALQTRIGRWPGLFLASMIFGLMHSGYGLPVEIVFASTIGLVFGLIYDWTDSIALIATIHGVLNVFLFGLLPLHGQFFQLPL